MLEKLHWLGHSSFRLEASKVIYFDPWKLAQDSPKADFILVSHDHFDHLSVEDIMQISTPATMIVTDKSSAQQVRTARVSCKDIKPLIPGEKLEFAGIKITAVPSYNTNKPFHPKFSKKLGFIVTIDGMSIYHAGDTDYIPEMKVFKCDIALLPVGGTYTMNVEEAVQAALDIKPEVAIPMHYGDAAGSTGDARRFAELLKGKVEVKILSRT
jgi:L-ascorbate metabolism protein UlaG (beta-lactamase superfamily)